MKKWILVALTGAAALCAGSSAKAQSQTGFKSNQFEPSETGSDWFANESLDLRGKVRPAIGVVADYGYRGVIGTYNHEGVVTASVVRDQAILHAGGSLVLADRIRLGLSLPIQMFAHGHTAFAGGVAYPPPANEQSVGDLRFSADLRIAGQYGDAATVAVGASVFAPIGQRDSYTGDEVWRLAPHLLLAGDIGAFTYAARAGYEYRNLTENYLDTRLGSTFTFGGAAGFRMFDKKFLLGPEVFGQTVVSNDHAFDERATPIEIMLGGHLNAADTIRINAGAGTFITKGYGAPVLRTLLGLEWAPGADKPDRDKDGVPDDEDACPDNPGEHTNDPRTNGCPPPPPDRDRDGIPDIHDACPDVAGVRTDDPKTNGCPPPPPDRDGDGVPDNEDACPDVKGVRTDDPKTNGCPSDRDKDGVLDAEDACPDVAGIRTSDPKTNGCPDTDRDKDGIPNDVDACPDEPGPKSEDPKTSGCPRVFVRNARIEILEQPKFDFNKATIKKDSDSLLTEVAKVMTDRPEIKRVRVEGHTDSVGNAAYNKKLSQQRADSVVKWLVAHGVSKDRLASEGIGKDRPLMSNDTDAGRAANRRVEFHIEQQDTTVKEEVKTPAGQVVPAPPALAPVPKQAAPTPLNKTP